ncbi:DNA topoisomerase III [Bacillus thermotolerans]|uniref:DNA topoisomerase n=1 Tax=Bacillus thermotolerans TaxID=1221996 RepID=A0A0F5IA48_BACTR|nr:DNA topoisomerase III [Bacillus thermotolerans]KKB38837.1 DNA topoisomerase III [Bacillus thermotolerans]KKB42494.1 DNA topoisomerase III [Bacillus thermotolerans]
MKLIIAEKPDQGRTLASPFTVTKREGYLEIAPNRFFPKGAYMTWAIGHLTQLAPPEAYKAEWKKWSLDTLPILPDRFQYEIAKSKYKQFQIVKKLLKDPQVTEIIHAGDAGREGELIIRNIIQLSGVKKPIKRLWISSLTKKAITEGFERLLDGRQTQSLYFEAYTRACADWIVGMNASRAYSLLLKQHGMNDVFSVGRVQTPTLALIVKREHEIANFKSETFWEVIARFNIDGKVYEGKWEKEGNSRLDKQEMAERIAEFCRGKEAAVHRVKKERKVFQPPLLFNLSSLQAAANSLFKFSPKKTLDTAQSLYQKGLLSYPRSDSNYVSKEEAEAFPDILHKLKQFPAYETLVPSSVPSLLNNKRFVNSKKVSDHYAIIPTEQVKNPDQLPADERKLYDLVARRLIAAHHDPAVFDYTTVTTLVDGRAEFISKGKQLIEEGWRQVLFPSDDDKEVILPPLQEKEKGTVEDVSVKEGKTQPPKRYTEGQLITLMKTAGKHLDNEELEKTLKKTEGLGTEATRAGIITMLKERKYIEVKKNQVYATDKAKVLIAAIGEKILASPEMTARWEQRLTKIGEGEASPAEFMEQTKKMAAKVVEDAVKMSADWSFTGLDTASIQRSSYKKSSRTPLGSCVKCEGKMVDKGTFYGCSNYSKTKCDFTLSKKILGKTITQAQIKKLLSTGKTDVIKGFKKGDNTFQAALELNRQDGKIRFIFS